MSRKHKKRNKVYQGEEVAAEVPNEPVVHHYTAVVRSPLGEWWQEHKRQVRIGTIVLGIGLVVIVLLYGLFDLIF